MPETLDQRADRLWGELRDIDAEMREVTSRRENVFAEYNECMAHLRERENTEPPKTRWDEATERWVDVTLNGEAEVVPLFPDGHPNADNPIE